jgi:hypothetical protein
MKTNHTKIIVLILFVGLFLFASGCATSRGIVDVKVSSSESPAGGLAVKVISVADSRKFEVAPKAQSTPSLSEEEIKDANIRSRAIGRKRNTYGKALGDFLLPEGKTVQGLVKDALSKALREKGYAVVEASSINYEKAIPLEADINQLWTFMTPGFWALTLEFETIVNIQGDVFQNSNEEQIRGYSRMSAQTGAESNYIEVMQNGIDNFIDNFKKKLRDSSPGK